VGLRGEIERPETVERVPPQGAWEVVGQFAFKDMTALHLQRKMQIANDRFMASRSPHAVH
jgi:hypothetical protein